MGQPRIFRENPLSLSLPEADFEQWLQESCAAGDVQLTARIKAYARDLGARPASYLESLWRRYHLPRVFLLVEDLYKPPLPWTSDFLHTENGPGPTYSVPASWRVAMNRIERNVERYPGNYIRIAFIVLCCILYKRPLALLGILMALKFLDSLLDHWQQTIHRKQSFIVRMTTWVMQLGVWMVMLYCKVLPTFFLAAFFSFIVVVAHSVLRDPISWPVIGQRQTRRLHQRAH